MESEEEVRHSNSNMCGMCSLPNECACSCKYNFQLNEKEEPAQMPSREELLEKVWNYEYYGDIRTVDVTICRIREKLGDSTKNSKILINKRGIGYYLATK